MNATVLLEIKESIGVITLNRPKLLNALNFQMLTELRRTATDIVGKDNVKTVILTGAGDKAFSSGADIHELANMNSSEATRFAELGRSALETFETLPLPVIAAVNGFAVGGGLELMSVCDLVVASNHSKFGIPGVALGVVTGWGGTQRIPQLVGPVRAKGLLLTGKLIGANEAKSWGLINQVVPSGQALHAARKLASRIMENSETALKLTKKAINIGLNKKRSKALKFELDAFADCFSTRDQKERMQAFASRQVKKS